MSRTEVEAIIERELPEMPGWCGVEKGKRMAELSYEAALCVELGVFGGRGLVAMSLALADQGFGRADGIDPYEARASLEGTNAPENDAWWGGLDYEAIARVAQMKICALGLFHHTRLVRVPSREVVAYYVNESIDVFHLDANHSEETSREDVALWAPKIKPGGYWVFDDTDWSTTQKAQQDLEALGFKMLEDHVQWKVYRK